MMKKSPGKTRKAAVPAAPRRSGAVKQGKVVEKAVTQTQRAVKNALKQKPLTLKR